MEEEVEEEIVEEAEIPIDEEYYMQRQGDSRM